MRKPFPTALFALTLLVVAALALWADTATFTPSPQGSSVFAVINADRSPGVATTSISVQWGSFRRTVIRGNQYGLCSGPMSGWVLRVESANPRPVPFTLTTTGTIARLPYQGFPPPELSHNCYKLERMRAR
jgi:hypothetical protein